jgi:exonuclease III
MTKQFKFKIATLNVKGLNNQQKQLNTLTLLKSYKLDLIMLQETNLNNENTQNFLKNQWIFDSIWTNKTAILAGNKDIIFKNIEFDLDNRIISTNFRFKDLTFQVTNVYAPPSQGDRKLFFDKWSPQPKENAINIIAGDFNTNLYPDKDRTSEAPPQRDITKELLQDCIKNYFDSSDMATTRPFHTFFQKTQGNRTMATHLDYIFVDENNAHLISQIDTKYGNSDHLLVECTLNFRSDRKGSALWRFNKNSFKNERLKKEVLEEISELEDIEDWDFCKICIQSIIRAFRKPKATEDKITKLNKSITQLNEKLAQNSENSFLNTQVDKLSSDLQKELQQFAEKWQIRSKAQWVEQGEKSTKYFFTRYKIRKTHSALKDIKDPETQLQSRENTLQYIRDKYAKIYEKEDINLNSAKKITENLPQVSVAHNTELTKEITQEEISNVIKNLPNNKSPGTDGLTYEFYKLSEETITPVLYGVFNHALSSGIMPTSWCKSLITLIPKKEIDLENINNWRPISLVNSDTKIFMKIIANRLNFICEKIIPPQQSGFVKNRSITDAALDIITTMRNQSDPSKQHWLLFIDQQKAFDRVNHNFLELTLKNMNFDPKFINLVHNLFSNQEAHIIESENISRPFRVERGVRQGDPLSPLLYVLAFEPLIRNLEKHLQGIKLENQYFKTSAYADDLTIGIGSPLDWNLVQSSLNLYEEASNAKINKTKTKLVPLTPIARRVELQNEEQFTKLEEHDSLVILGYNVLVNGQPKKDLWSITISKLKESLNKITNRNLSFKGKILIAKSLILSRIWYSAYLQPPSRKQAAEINRVISFWIKGTSRMLPRYSTFQQPLEQAGLQAPIIKDMLDARMISVWIKLLTSNSFWAKYEREKISLLLRTKRNISPTQALNANNIRTKAWPTEWKPFLVAWTRIGGKVPPTSSWPWDKKEITIDELRGDELSVKKILELLRKSIPPPISSQLSLQENQLSWLQIKPICNKKKDVFWRLFHRALPLGYRLKYIGSTETGNCVWCTEKLQTLEHFAIECSISSIIWKEAYKCLNITEEKSLPLTLENIFQGSNINCVQATPAIIWLHINIIYEIWCRYTSLKWGNTDLPFNSLKSLIRNRISREIQVLKYNLANSKSKTSKTLCKYLKCI